jgi:uncharacterized membrane protein
VVGLALLPLLLGAPTLNVHSSNGSISVVLLTMVTFVSTLSESPLQKILVIILPMGVLVIIAMSLYEFPYRKR